LTLLPKYEAAQSLSQVRTRFVLLKSTFQDLWEDCKPGNSREC
jgi:hypothetical protein